LEMKKVWKLWMLECGEEGSKFELMEKVEDMAHCKFKLLSSIVEDFTFFFYWLNPKKHERKNWRWSISLYTLSILNYKESKYFRFIE
jgi:hypothetical protein